MACHVPTLDPPEECIAGSIFAIENWKGLYKFDFTW
jgi:hypothetical protein